MHHLLLLVLLFTATSSAHAAFENCSNYFPNQQPPQITQSPGQLRDICFDGFAVWHSGRSKTPVVVVERMNRARLIDAQDEDRTDRFYEEARLPFAHRARLEDYRGTGYDRGHMAPAADMPTPEAMAQSFSLANMTPQEPSVNRHIWSRNVERATRKYVMRATGDVYVYTGALFSGPRKTIGEGRVWIPSYLYKLVYDEDQNRAWAFFVANRDDAQMSPPITYEALVQRTGIELLPGLSPRPRVADSSTSTLDRKSSSSMSGNGQSAFTCGSKRICGQMESCEEARHYLTNCGLSRLDGDGDGTPCESLCR